MTPPPTPPTKKVGIAPESEARLLRLSENEDFKREFAQPWQDLAAKALNQAVKEAMSPAAERNDRAVVDWVREYAFYTAQHQAVFGTLADLAKARKASTKEGLQPESAES